MKEVLGFTIATTYIFAALGFLLLYIVGLFKIYQKAGENGIKAFIPLYNTYILFKITYGNGWKFLWLLVPFVNIYFGIMLNFKLAKVFGKGIGFGIGLLFLPSIFTIILGFDDSKYLGYEYQEM